MTMHAFNATVRFSAPLSRAAGDSLVIGPDGLVHGQGDLFIGLNAGPTSIVVAGTPTPSGFAITLGTYRNEASGCRFSATSGGLVQGVVGLPGFGSNLLVRYAGTISGDNTAIYLDGGTAGRATTFSAPARAKSRWTAPGRRQAGPRATVAAASRMSSARPSPTLSAAPLATTTAS